ncbi:hypothetical protein DFR49_0750 [Hephaestia caeni]|uniref:Uncharacterized protein n=1 Tax=Hephaestia caeni TaxID=645617 RepID=A0A397PGC1_9SPHN|nr:hypothetical protein [Hephaestia caeni]RIA46217.1 hypothetical protein DFR49_0750 [Hephaestia caeni]
MNDSAAYARGPVIIRDDMLMTARGTHLFRLIEQPGLGAAAETIKTQLADSYSSYGRHCGHAAPRLAQEDLFGEVLSALYALAADQGASGRGVRTEADAPYEAALVALIKADMLPPECR